jgi:hypothetical protein
MVTSSLIIQKVRCSEQMLTWDVHNLDMLAYSSCDSSLVTECNHRRGCTLNWSKK